MADISMDKGSWKMAAPCLICGTFVDLNQHESSQVWDGKTVVKICRECKNAMVYLKQKMRSENG